MDDQGADRWLNKLSGDEDATVRLICFHHAGGSATSFAPLARHICPGIEVFAIQAPGRQERHAEPCLESVDQLAQDALAAVRTLLGCDVALFGHSLGASVAFEVARLLEQTGVTPRRLFVSSRRAPSIRRTEDVHRRSDHDIAAEIRHVGGPGAELLADRDLTRTLIATIRSDYTAAETYRRLADTQVACPISAIVGDADPREPVPHVEQWRVHTKGPCTTYVLPGGHFYIADRLHDVAQLIERDLLKTADRPLAALGPMRLGFGARPVASNTDGT